MKTPERQVNLIDQGVNFQPSGASSQFYNELSGSLDTIAKDMQSKANIIYTNDFLTGARQSAKDIYEQHRGDPSQLQKELTAYKSGLLKDMPAHLKPQLDTEYNSLAESYINKAQLTQSKEINRNFELSLKKNEDIIIQDSLQAISNVFDADGQMTASQEEGEYINEC
jgi:hypothetical protein